MRATGWFLLGAFLLGCDPPRAAERTATRERAPAIVAFQSDSQGEEIRDIAVGSRIWAVNRTAPALARYSRDGRLEWHGLEQGEGPDQVSTAWSVVAIGDTAFVWDPRARRLARVVDGRVAPEATFGFATTRVISEPAHGINFGHPGRLRPYRSGWVTYATEERQSQAADLTPIVLLHFDRAGQVIDTLADLRSPSRPADRGAEGGNGPKELVPMPLWDVCQGERLVFFDPKGPLLWWDRLGGGGRDSLHFDFVPGPIPESFLRAHMYWQLQVAAQGRISEDTLRSWLDLSLQQRGSIFGKVAPYAVKLFCDGTGRAWLERFDLEAPPRGLGRTWLVIDLATKTVREATVPPGFQALAADSLTLYGTVVDGGGVSAVATVEIGSVMR